MLPLRSPALQSLQQVVSDMMQSHQGKVGIRCEVGSPRRTLRMRMPSAVKPGADCLLAVKVDPASLSTGRDVERIKHGLQKRLARSHSCLSLSRAAFAATLAGWRLSMEFRLWPSRKVTRLRLETADRDRRNAHQYAIASAPRLTEFMFGLLVVAV
jgi:hypothetical protein